MDNDHLFIAYFDTSGFESIIDLTLYEQEYIWSQLKVEKTSKKRLEAIPYFMLRARANPQRFPEIWTFNSDLDQNTLIDYGKNYPQELADLIRNNGKKLFSTPKEKQIIK
jgi:hypothetical protein